MGALDDLDHVQVETRAQWRRWLQRHHQTTRGVWLVTWRQGSGRPVLGYEAICEEAICFGWVDSRPGKVDDTRTKILVTPRKPGSKWSRPNKERVARLEAAGRLAPAGVAVIDAAKADGSWSALDAVEDLVVPDDLEAAFARHPGRGSTGTRSPAR